MAWWQNVARGATQLTQKVLGNETPVTQVVNPGAQTPDQARQGTRGVEYGQLNRNQDITPEMLAAIAADPSAPIGDRVNPTMRQAFQDPTSYGNMSRSFMQRNFQGPVSQTARGFGRAPTYTTNDGRPRSQNRGYQGGPLARNPRPTGGVSLGIGGLIPETFGGFPQDSNTVIPKLPDPEANQRPQNARPQIDATAIRGILNALGMMYQRQPLPEAVDFITQMMQDGATGQAYQNRDSRNEAVRALLQTIGQLTPGAMGQNLSSAQRGIMREARETGARDIQQASRAAGSSQSALAGMLLNDLNARTEEAMGRLALDVQDMAARNQANLTNSITSATQVDPVFDQLQRIADIGSRFETVQASPVMPQLEEFLARFNVQGEITPQEQIDQTQELADAIPDYEEIIRQLSANTLQSPWRSSYNIGPNPLNRREITSPRIPRIPRALIV